MTKWLQWIILTSITGSPLLSICILLVFWWTLDRVTFRFLPSPVRWLARWQRAGRLERTILGNPHDRRSRFELAEIRVEQKRYRKALELLRPNLEAGDDDANTLFVMALACLGSGHTEQGELFLSEAEKSDPHFRLGAIDLERGRWRLARGDAKGAREALERFCNVRKGTVEGRVLLARAVERSGDDGKAALIRQEAWNEYVAAPRFQRNMERFWAWRARPSRPLTYAVGVLLVASLFARFVAPSLEEAAHRYRQSQMEQDYDEEEEE